MSDKNVGFGEQSPPTKRGTVQSAFTRTASSTKNRITDRVSQPGVSDDRASASAGRES